LKNASNLFELPQVTIVPKTQWIHLMAKLRKSEHPGLIHLIFDMYSVYTKSVENPYMFFKQLKIKQLKYGLKKPYKATYPCGHAHRANALKCLLRYNIIIKSSESRKFTAFFYENKTKACSFAVFL
jgi:signal-transduction protein with cAMP-binding, CBS, and nucleotidyltransferase domain